MRAVISCYQDPIVPQCGDGGRVQRTGLQGVPSRLPTALRRAALRKLEYLDSAGLLDDLRVPPGNCLERLRGDRRGQWSIRINDRYRICFVWTELGPEQVVIVDYH